MPARPRSIFTAVALVAACAVGGSIAAFAANGPEAPTPGAVSPAESEGSTLIQSGTRAVYSAITPCRLADTREEFLVGPRSTPIGTDETLVIDINSQLGECARSQLPLAADALALNVTAVGATAPTFLAIWPDGDRPGASALNPTPGSPPIPNAVIAKLSNAEQFRIYNLAGEVDVIVDVVGFFEDHHHDDRYYTEAESDQFRSTITDRVSALEAGGSTEGRTTFVGGDGTSGQNGANLQAAITAASGEGPTASEPWIIRVDAGAFTTNELTLPAHVHLQGSGQGVTIIGGRITATGGTSISSLTIDNPAVTTFRSITTSSDLTIDDVEVLGDSGLAVGTGADVTITNSLFTIGNGPIVTTTSSPVSAAVSVVNTRLSNTGGGGTAVEVDGGTLDLHDVTGSFANNGVAANTVTIDGSHLTANGQFEVTNAGTMTVTNSYLERSPATTFRVISVVGGGSELTVIQSSVMGGGGGGDDAVGGGSESCTAVAHDEGFNATGCP